MNKIIKPSSGIITPKLTEIEFKVEFKRRLTELQKWGLHNGFYITAYLETKSEGAFPRIGYRPLTQEEEKLV